MNKGVSFIGRVKRGYCCRKHDKKRSYKKTRFCWSTCSDKENFNYCHGFYRIHSETRTCFIDNPHSIEQRFSWLLCLSPFKHLLYLLNSFVLVFFLFHWSLPVIYHISDLIENMVLYCFCWLFEFMLWQTFQTANMYETSSWLWKAVKYGHDTMKKNLPIAY